MTIVAGSQAGHSKKSNGGRSAKGEWEGWDGKGSLERIRD